MGLRAHNRLLVDREFLAGFWQVISMEGVSETWMEIRMVGCYDKIWLCHYSRCTIYEKTLKASAILGIKPNPRDLTYYLLSHQNSPNQVQSISITSGSLSIAGGFGGVEVPPFSSL